MHIAFAVDAAYFEHAAVAIESILQFDYLEQVDFWLLLANDVDEAFKARLSRAINDRARIHYLSAADMPEYGTSADPNTQHVSSAMYLRLRLVDLLPRSVARIIYLDADVLCTSPGLEELYNTDLHGCTIGAVRDAFTRRMNDHGGLPLIEKFTQIDPQDLYFNSGVILIDTLAWRLRHISERADAYLALTRSARRFPDQDALNVACHRDWHRLDKRWNHMMAWRLEDGRSGTLSQAVIIHSAGPVKHWQVDFPNGRRRELYERLARTVRSTPARD